MNTQQHPNGLLASLAIQCKHPDTGQTGCWLFGGESHRNPGSSKTPVFPDLAGLFAHCKDNGWNQIGSDGMRYVYHTFMDKTRTRQVAEPSRNEIEEESVQFQPRMARMGV